mgnify:CR=1 FL=1
MADIRLAKPAAGTTQTVPSAPNGRFIFDFPADAATLTRNGDDLVLTFEDGSSIQLQGFYTTYSKEEMPSFQVEGVEISGQDFFAALGEDLMPAAGPAASSASRSGRYNEYGGSDLLDGIDHLGRLDIGFDGGTQLATDTVEPSAPEVDIDYDVTIAAGPEAGAVDLTVYEGGLAGGSQAGQAATPTTASGSLNINAPDGVASIVIGDVVVFANGKLTGNVVTTDEGTLTVTGYNPVTGKLEFSYELTGNTTEHVKSDPVTDTQISHDLTVTVTDTDGDSASSTITVNVVDDAPSAEGLTLTPIADTAASISGQVEGLVFGADSDGSTVTVTVTVNGNVHSYTGRVSGTGEGITIDFGPDSPVTLDKDGKLTYQRGDEVGDKKDDTYKFTVQVTDKDGDVSQAVEAELGTTTPDLPDENPSQPGIQVDEISVREEALSTGSNASSPNEKAGGEFTVDLKGQDGKITFGDVTITVKDGVVESISGDSFTTGLGSTVSGIQASIADGKVTVSYEYTLNTRQDHAEGDGKNTTTENITVTVSNEYGDSQSGDVVVTIVDDVPVLNSITVEGTPYGEGNSGVYIKDPNHITGTLDGLNTGADAEGSTMRVSIGDDYFLGTYENGTWKFTPADNDFTPDETEGGLFSFDGNKFTYIPSVQVEPGEDFSYTMQVTVTDGDGDSTLEVKSATMRPENNPPIAEDDSFYIDKDSHFESEITVQTNGTLISVKGEASFKGNVAGDTGADHTLEYGYSQGDINGSAIQNSEILTETSDDFFGRFFKDSNGNPLTMDDMVENGMLQTVLITSSVSEADIVQAINEAQTEAEREGKVLYLTGENGEKVDISLSGHTFGTSDNPLTVIINGTMSSKNQITVNGFLYVDGDVDINAQLTVNGGLAVSGNMTQSGNVRGTYPEGGEVSTEIIGSVNSFEISFDDILKNDSDPDNDSVSIVEDSITLADDLKAYYSISVDYENDRVTVTPLGGSDGIADYEQPLKLEYTIQDEHGATDSAVITVSAVGHVTGSSHADTIIGSNASEVITADVSGEGGLSVPGQNYNLCIVLDSSGSMAWNMAGKETWDKDSQRLTIAKNSIETLLNNLAEQNIDGTINLSIVDFDSGSKLSFNGTLNDLCTEDAEGQWHLKENALSDVWKQINNTGGTNYEAAFLQAEKWFRDQADNGCGKEDGYTNFTYFVTDGVPTSRYENSFERGSWPFTTTIAIPERIGIGEDWTDAQGLTYRLELGRSNEYGTNTLQVVQVLANGKTQVIESDLLTNDWSGQTESDQERLDSLAAAAELKEVSEVFVIGVGNKDQLPDNLGQYSSNGSYILATNTEELNNALNAGLNAMFSAVPSSDTIYGGAGDDVIFGDSGMPNMKAVIAAAIGGGVTAETISDAQILEYIRQHPEQFDVSQTSGEATVEGETVPVEEFDKADTLLGGSGDDIIYGQGGDDLLFGDGSDTATSNSDIETLETLNRLLTEAGAEEDDSYAERIQGLETQGSQEEPSELDSFIDSLEGTGGIEKDTDGDDRLFGGAGDDVIFGGAGDDFIDGGEGRDTIFGGSGNDIIVYDSNDYLVSGGSGIDFMVSGDTTLTLSSLLGNSGSDKPLVSGIEVLLKGDAALSLTSLDQLAKDYGITLDTNAEGKETLILDMDKWTYQKESGVYTSTNEGNLILETNLTPVEASDPASEAVQQQVFTLEHGNG